MPLENRAAHCKAFSFPCQKSFSCPKSWFISFVCNAYTVHEHAFLLGLTSSLMYSYRYFIELLSLLHLLGILFVCIYKRNSLKQALHSCAQVSKYYLQKTNGIYGEESRSFLWDDQDYTFLQMTDMRWVSYLLQLMFVLLSVPIHSA